MSGNMWFVSGSENVCGHVGLSGVPGSSPGVWEDVECHAMLTVPRTCVNMCVDVCCAAICVGSEAACVLVK